MVRQFIEMRILDIDSSKTKRDFGVTCSASKRVLTCIFGLPYNWKIIFLSQPLLEKYLEMLSNLTSLIKVADVMLTGNWPRFGVYCSCLGLFNPATKIWGGPWSSTRICCHGYTIKLPTWPKKISLAVAKSRGTYRYSDWPVFWPKFSLVLHVRASRCID